MILRLVRRTVRRHSSKARDVDAVRTPELVGYGARL